MTELINLSYHFFLEVVGKRPGIEKKIIKENIKGIYIQEGRKENKEMN